MYRDFTEQAKRQLKEYINEVTPQGFFETLADRISDFFKNFSETDVNNYTGQFEGYQKRVLDVKNIGKKNVDKLFEKEWGVEKGYTDWLSGACNEYDAAIIERMRTTLDLLDSNGAGFDFSAEKMQRVYAADEAVNRAAANIATAKGQIKTQEETVAKLKKEKQGKRGEYNLFSADPVNLATGNFIYEKTDITLEGEIPLSFRRFYNAQDKTGGVLGQGYRHNHEMELREEEGGVEVIMDDGNSRFFARTEDGGYEGILATRDVMEVLTEEDGVNSYVMTTPDGEKYYFNARGRLVCRKDLNGRQICYTYNGADQLVRVESDRGDFLTFSYHEMGLLASVTTSQDRDVRYEYEDGRLDHVIMANGNRYYYRYTQNGEMQEIKNAREVITVKNTYDDQCRITRQEFPDGTEMLYEYQGNELILTERNGSRITYVHDDKLRNTDVKYEDGTTEHFEYNEKSQKTLVRDRNGNTTRFSYDDRGNVVKVINALGQISTMAYDDNNKLLNLKVNRVEVIKNVYDKKGNLIVSYEADGNQKVYKYDDLGRVTSIENADHELMEIFYNQRGLVEKIIDNGVQTSYVYDNNENVIGVLDAYGNKTKYAYDFNNQLVNIENAVGEKAEFEYDLQGNITQITDFDGYSVRTEYNELNKESAITDKEGYTTRYEYDNMWNVARVLHPNGTNTQYLYNVDNRLCQVEGTACDTQKFVYDAIGNLIIEENGNGEKTQYVYDSLNRIKKVIDARGFSTSYTYDNQGNVKEKIDAKGNKWNLEYDRNGRCICETDPLGNSTCYEYTPGGRLKRKTMPNGAWESYEYENGKVKEYRKSAGDIIKYTYDLNGKLSSQENCMGERIQFSYDAIGRLDKVVIPSGSTREFAYNSVNQVTQIKDENGNVTRYTYSPKGKLLSVIDALEHVTEYKYDCVGNLIEIIQKGDVEEDQITQYIWNDKNQIVQIVNPLGDGESYQYDFAGNVISKIDGDGYETKMSYDAGGNLEKITYADNTAIDFMYDELNILKEIRDWNGITSIVNDEMGRPLKITDAEGVSIGYEWGKVGEKSKITYPDGSEVNYEYGKNGLLSHLKTQNGTISYSYDKLGRLIQKNMPNGASEKIDYNANGQVTLMQYRGVDHFEEYQYGYDAAGNKIWTKKRSDIDQEVPETFAYSYDKINQLTKVVENDSLCREYVYDSFGNRKELAEFYEGKQNYQTTYTYNKANQLIQKIENDRQYIYSYDRRGNLSNISDENKDVQQYIFDEKNLLMKAYCHSDNQHNEILYQYNGLGYLTNVTTKRNNVETITEKYTIDLTKQYKNTLGTVRSTDSSSAETTNFVYDNNVVQFDRNHVTNYYYNDELGSVLNITDSSGKLVEKYSYDEFGRMKTANRLEPHYQPFGYTGYQFDQIDNLYYAQARRYDASSGRFISQDKLPGSQELVLSLHRYLYCVNRVFYYVDPDGLMCHVLAGAIVGGLVDGGMELISELADGGVDNLSLRKIGIAFAGGFAKGGLTAAGVPPIAANTIVNAATTCVNDLIDGKSVKEIGLDVATSVGTDLVMSAGGTVMKKAGVALKNTKVSKKVTQMVGKMQPIKAIDNFLKNNAVTKVANKADRYYRMVMTKGRRYHTEAHAATIKNGLISGYYEGITGKIKDKITPYGRIKQDVEDFVEHNTQLGIESCIECIA